jgi:hypothetical protein
LQLSLHYYPFAKQSQYPFRQKFFLHLHPFFSLIKDLACILVEDLLLQSTHLHKFEQVYPSLMQKQYFDEHFLLVQAQPTFFFLYLG